MASLIVKVITKLSFTVDSFLLEYSFTISTEYFCRPGHFFCTVFLLSMCTCSHAHPSHRLLVSFSPPGYQRVRQKLGPWLQGDCAPWRTS